jgi:NAD-dependent DNA ligase
MSRSALNLPTYTLGAVSNALGVKHEGAHRALSDAQSASEVLMRIVLSTECSTIDDAGKQLKVSRGKLFQDSWLPCRSRVFLSKADESQRFTERLSSIGVDGHSPDPSGDFYGKAVAITGTLVSMKREEAQSLLVQAGAIVKDGVSSKLDYLVAGMQDSQRLVKGEVQSSKYRKVEEMRSKGSGIEIIDEEQFLQMLRD